MSTIFEEGGGVTEEWRREHCVLLVGGEDQDGSDEESMERIVASSDLEGDEEKEERNLVWNMGNTRKMKTVILKDFKGKAFIEIRNYYVDRITMDIRPRKRGIILNYHKYKKLKSIIGNIDHALSEKAYDSGEGVIDESPAGGIKNPHKETTRSFGGFSHGWSR